MSQEQGQVFAQYPSLSSFFRRKEVDAEETSEDQRLPKRQRGATPDSSSQPENEPPEAGDEVVATPMCQCAAPQPSVRRVVQKEGANKGRTFNACSRPRGMQCTYFEWADVSSTSAERPPPSSSEPPSVAAGAMTCRCGDPAVLKTVQKEGANKGRGFWCCSKPRGSGCSLFAWADDASQRADLPVPVSEEAVRGGPSNASSTGSACFKCGLPGHWARNCPASQSQAGRGVASNQESRRRF